MVRTPPIASTIALLISVSLLLAGCLSGPTSDGSPGDDAGEGGADATGGGDGGDGTGAAGNGSGDGVGGDGLDTDPHPERDRASDFTVLTTAGEVWTLSDKRGTVVLLYFMSPQCTACKYYHPELLEFLATPEASDLAFLALGAWYSDTQQMMVEYAAEPGNDFPVALDTSGATQAYGISETPTYFLIDAYGGIVSSFGGGSAEQMVAKLGAI